MRIIPTIFLLLFTLLPAGAVKRIEANPINVAVVLVEKADSANIDGYFKYYGYEFKGIEDGYNVMRHDNGDEIHYSFKKDGISQKRPTVVVRITESQKYLDSRLHELKFKRSGHTYERTISRYNKYVTQGNLGSLNQLKFERILK